MLQALRVPHTTTDHARASLLREAVLLHREQERRRHFPARLNVGVPGQHTQTYAESEPSDHGLRTDIVGAMLERTALIADSRIAWLTRPGRLMPHDVDSRWASAVRCARGEAGVPLDFVVVTREGWYDPLTGVSRSWVRLRRAPVTVPRPRPADQSTYEAQTS